MCVVLEDVDVKNLVRKTKAYTGSWREVFSFLGNLVVCCCKLV
jgi:hypothetical protein